MARRTLVTVAMVIAAAFASLSAQEIQKDGVTLPSPIRTIKAGYTAAAMEARIEGTVLMAVTQWLFKAGTKEGKPVAVHVTIEMTFTLK